MARYRVRLEVALIEPDAPPLEDASGDGESAQASWQGDVWAPTPIVRTLGASGILQVALRNLKGCSITDQCYERLMKQLRTPVGT